MLVGAVQPAQANHSVTGNLRYPNNGFLWLSAQKNYNGAMWLESNQPKGCLPREQDRPNEVWTNIHNSTQGQSSMGRYTYGISMSNHGCNGTLSADGASFTFSGNLIDSAIAWDQDTSHFRQPNGSYIGGRNRISRAPDSFCAANGVVPPCGNRSFVQINWNKWVADGSATGDAYRRREILHETGHTHGLIDCPSNYYGMMMNGSCGWDTNITGWNADDRASVSSIYP